MAATLEAFVEVCRVDDLPVRGKKTVHVNGTHILIVACETGLHAVENACPQTGRPIAHGKVINCTITSPATGARYDLQTGQYIGGGIAPLQSHWLTVYPVQVIDGSVYIQPLHL